MIHFTFVITAISACLGAAVVVGGIKDAVSAPQQAAAAAIGIAAAVIPYVFSRCLQIMSDSWALRSKMDRAIELLEKSAIGAQTIFEYKAASTAKTAGGDQGGVAPAAPQGECPNCKRIIPLASESCPSCKSIFGPHSAWKIKALSPQIDGGTVATAVSK